ncbi:MAG: Lin0512 family protein [Pseudomonadota bacterium]
MSDQRFIIEMGTGNDLYGMDYTKAAIRAVEDAMRHSSIPLFERLGISHTQMRVQVTIGVQAPSEVDLRAIADYMPRGRVEVAAVAGGLNVTNSETDQTLVIATAAVEAFLPNQSAGWRVSNDPQA